MLVKRDQTHGWIAADWSLLISEGMVCGGSRFALQFAVERHWAERGGVAGRKRAPMECG